MTHRLDERATPPHQALHWPQPVALAPDDSPSAPARDRISFEREPLRAAEPTSSARGSVLGLLAATTFAALVMMALTLAVLYRGGVFAPGVP